RPVKIGRCRLLANEPLRCEPRGFFACRERRGRHEMHDLHDFSAVHGLQEAVFPGLSCKPCKSCKTFKPCRVYKTMQIMQNVQTMQGIETMQTMQTMQVMQEGGRGLRCGRCTASRR